MSLASWLFIHDLITALSDQPVVDTATATEQAKMLIKSGAISAIKSENKNSGFKRSRMLEIKLKVKYCPYTCFTPSTFCLSLLCNIFFSVCVRALHHRTLKRARFQLSYLSKGAFLQMKSNPR